MATIYRFIVEQRTSTTGNGRNPRQGSGKTTGKQGRSLSLFGNKGGVEHNRKMRAINPLLNKMTGGWWEKGTRLSRAGIGLGKSVSKNGAKGILTGPALYIIIAFCITMLIKWQQTEAKKAKEMNAKNFKQLENGIGAIHGQYKISTAFWTGRHTYNQNK